MRHLITAVDGGSIADELGIEPGFWLLSINGEELEDVIDYQQLTAQEELTVLFETPEGEQIEAQVEKDEYETLGLTFERGMLYGIKTCKNHCLFCFIDQMPKAKRDTLFVKDDDWRMSLIMGNYITLTNVSDAEFDRIIRRRVSPLYISVHSLNPDLRVKLMGNPSAKLINKRLRRLADAGMRFNCQIVLCPGYNDGVELERTLTGLMALYPAAQSVAVVPVGLTKHREGLHKLRGLTEQEAGETIALIEGLNANFAKQHGAHFAFAADEMYVLANRPLPDYNAYGDFPQLENGVGLMRKFEYEFMCALEEKHTLGQAKKLCAVTGESACGFLSQLFKALERYNIFIDLRKIENKFFGKTVTVAGLMCGCDIIEQLKGNVVGDTLLIPDCALRENDDVLLDGMTTMELGRALGLKVKALCSADGYSFVDELFDCLLA